MTKEDWMKVLAVFLITSSICAGIVYGVFYAKNKQETISEEKVVVIDETEEPSGEIMVPSGEEPQVEEPYLGPNIFSGDARPIAVMIDNEKPAWVNHGGLNYAYMLYEFIIEGGETRIMAFFKNVNPDYIGPVRSARHYFLDYAMEHDAVFVHFGWSPKAQSDIKTLGINNINGIFDTFYWRVPPKSSYHNAITNMEKIKEMMVTKKYRDTSDKECIIHYNQHDEELESGESANNIMVKYSNLQNTSYEYDEERKIYLRSMRGIPHNDSQTGEQFYAKNIVMIYVKDLLLDDPEDKGRRELYNIGKGNGYYATNGKIIPITWEKIMRGGRTVYKDLYDNEISFNDGITWVQIVPITGSITFN